MKIRQTNIAAGELGKRPVCGRAKLPENNLETRTVLRVDEILDETPPQAVEAHFKPNYNTATPQKLFYDSGALSSSASNPD